MFDLNFKLHRPENYKHPFKVVSVDVTDADEKELKEVHFTVKSINAKNTNEYVISTLMHEKEMEQNAKLNIATTFLSFISDHAVNKKINNEFVIVEELELITNLISTVMDTLAQELTYDTIINNIDPVAMFSALILCAAGLEYHPNPTLIETVTKQELLDNIHPIYFVYEQFKELSISDLQLKKLNDGFWSSMAFLTRYNGLVYIEGTDEIPTFTDLAKKQADVTLELLHRAIENSLNYFDKDRIKFELTTLVKQTKFNADKTQLTIPDFYQNTMNGVCITNYGLAYIRITVAVLLRAYLIFVKKNLDESVLKELIKNIDDIIRQLNNSSVNTEIMMFDSLFTFTKVKSTTNNNFDVEIKLDERITNIINQIVFKS